MLIVYPGLYAAIYSRNGLSEMFKSTISYFMDQFVAPNFLHYSML